MPGMTCDGHLVTEEDRTPLLRSKRHGHMYARVYVSTYVHTVCMVSIYVMYK